MALYIDLQVNNKRIHRIAVRNIDNKKYAMSFYKEIEATAEDRVAFLASGGKVGKLNSEWVLKNTGIVIHNESGCDAIDLAIKMLKEYKKLQK